MAETLFHKVWNRHAVRTLSSGQTQLFVGLHLVHEVTSPQAFDMLRQLGWRVDLSQFGAGTIAATREAPAPVVTVRIRLDGS